MSRKSFSTATADSVIAGPKGYGHELMRHRRTSAFISIDALTVSPHGFAVPSILFDRDRGSDERRFHRPGGTNRNHNCVPERIQKRIGVPLLVVRDPDVSRRVYLGARDPFQGVAPVAGVRRDRLSDVHPCRTIRGRDAA